MKKMYYKLNLEGSAFWQEENGIFTKKPFVTKDFDYLNNVYFNRIDDNIYMERLTGVRLILDKDKLVEPYGIEIDLSKFTPCNRSEVLESFNALKHNNLNKEYFKILEDLLINSEYCELLRDEDIIKK